MRGYLIKYMQRMSIIYWYRGPLLTWSIVSRLFVSAQNVTYSGTMLMEVLKPWLEGWHISHQDYRDRDGQSGHLHLLHFRGACYPFRQVRMVIYLIEIKLTKLAGICRPSWDGMRLHGYSECALKYGHDQDKRRDMHLLKIPQSAARQCATHRLLHTAGT